MHVDHNIINAILGIWQVDGVQSCFPAVMIGCSFCSLLYLGSPLDGSFLLPAKCRCLVMTSN